MTVKKLVGYLHLWLGLASGLVVLVLGVTGCLYAFADELRPLLYRDRLTVAVPPAARPLPLDALRASAQRALGPRYPLGDAQVSARPGRTVAFRARRFDEAAWLYSPYCPYYYTAYVNPYSGRVVAVENTKWEFFNLVVMLHTTLLLGQPGHLVVGASVLVFVVLLATGLVLWWPKNGPAARQRLWFRWKSTTKWKRKNYDLHNIPGFYTLPLAFVIALTGLTWSFEWVDAGAQWLANGGRPSPLVQPVYSDTTRANRVPLATVLRTAAERTPAADNFFVLLPAAANRRATVLVYAQREGQPYYRVIRSQYDQATGQRLRQQEFGQGSRGEQLQALTYDLHTGGLGGLPGKALAFVGSLVAAALPVTGFLLWRGRRRKRRRRPAAPYQASQLV